MDTHLHSKASDGLWTPAEVVKQAKLRGLKAIALTDHDTTIGVQEALDASVKEGIRVISGIEIDAEYKKKSIKVEDIELLGLNIDLLRIQDFVDKRADSRLKSLEAYVNNFNDYINSKEFGQKNDNMKYHLQNPSELSVDKIISWRNINDKYQNPRPFLSKMDIVNFLLEHFASPSEAIEKAKGGNRVYSGEFKDEYGFLFNEKEIKPSFSEAICAVKNARGFAILAHPGLSKGYNGGMIKEWEREERKWFSEHTEEFTPYHFVKELLIDGLDGVELYFYAGNDKAHAKIQDRINQYFGDMAKKLKIMTTYGSDCHGPKANGPLIGKFGSEKIYL